MSPVRIPREAVWVPRERDIGNSKLVVPGARAGHSRVALIMWEAASIDWRRGRLVNSYFKKTDLDVQ